MKKRLNLGMILCGVAICFTLAWTGKKFAVMIDESNICSQFVNLNAGAQLYSLNIATEAYAVEHSGTGGMWTLVERWEPGSNTDSHMFSGLNGDTDRRYLIVSKVVANGSTGQYFLRPNNDSGSNYSVRVLSGYGATDLENVRYSWTGFDIGYTGDANLSFNQLELYAKSGTNRMALSTFTRINSTPLTQSTGTYGGLWIDSANNITSISVNAPSGGNFGVGSCVELWKLAQ